jgi:hypothetical protein
MDAGAGRACADGANTGGEGGSQARSGGAELEKKGNSGSLPERGRRDGRRRSSGQLRRGCRSDAACPFEVIVRRRGEGRGRGAREAGGYLHRMPEPRRWWRGERTEGGITSREERTRFGDWGVMGAGQAGHGVRLIEGRRWRGLRARRQGWRCTVPRGKDCRLGGEDGGRERRWMTGRGRRESRRQSWAAISGGCLRGGRGRGRTWWCTVWTSTHRAYRVVEIVLYNIFSWLLEPPHKHETLILMITYFHS